MSQGDSSLPPSLITGYASAFKRAPATTIPPTAASNEPIKMPKFAQLISLGSEHLLKCGLAIKMDIAKAVPTQNADRHDLLISGPCGRCAGETQRQPANRLIPKHQSADDVIPNGGMEVRPSIDALKGNAGIRKSESGSGSGTCDHGCGNMLQTLTGERPCFFFQRNKEPTMTPASVA